MRRTLLASLLLTTTFAPLSAQGAIGRRVVGDSTRAAFLGRTGDSIRVSYFGVPASRARIGVVVSLAPSANDRYGALIESVVPKGPADLAGIRASDIIARVNETIIGDAAIAGGANGFSLVADRLMNALSELQPGKAAVLELRRGNGTLSVKVTPERDESVVATTIDMPRFLDEARVSGELRDFIARGGFANDSIRGSLRIMMDSVRIGAAPLARTSGGVFVVDSGRGGGTMTIRRLMTNGDTVARIDTTFTFGRGAMMGRAMAGDMPARGLIEFRTLFDSTLRGVASERAITAMRSTEEARALERATAGSLIGGRPGEAVPPRGVTTTLRSSFDALSRLELSALNPGLGTYFGITEGVLVISISPPGVLTVNGTVVPAEKRGTIAPSTTAGRVAGSAPAGKGEPTAGDTELLNLKPGDVITAVDGRPVATPSQLMRILRSYARSDDLKLTVFRQKKSLNINTRMPS